MAIVNSPLVHLGGLFRILQCVNDGRSFALLERFTVDGWVDAVRRHRPQTASLVPAALRMVLEADLDRADLSSLRSVVSGTAPLYPDDADAFFGATASRCSSPTRPPSSVAASPAGTSPTTSSSGRRSAAASAGPTRGCELRVVDPADGHVLGADEEGLLEVKAAQLGAGSGWIRTTDLARIDADGFVWILGRADQAIIRGGFKVLPDVVRRALERHPRVRGAAVIGRRRRPARRGPGRGGRAARRPRRTAAAGPARRTLADALARYELPVEIRFVDELPRTDSGKVDLAACPSSSTADLDRGG